MASNFEEEALEWALDQDSVQSLLQQADRWKLTKVDALSIVLTLQSAGHLRFYEKATDQNEYIDIPGSMITLKYLESRHYTWIGVTSLTLPELNRRYALSRNKIENAKA